jgi:putative transposase
LVRSLEEKRRLIEPDNSQISISRQCELLELARPSYYYQPRPVSELNLKLMRRIDEIYTDTPYFGVRKVTACLQNEGYQINHKRIERLMHEMGLVAIYPKPKLSKPGQGAQHRIYPYVLRGRRIDSINQVWSTDITFIPMPKGYVYLVAIMDWYSRYVLAWELSVTMETEFCLEALNRALRQAQPQIFNTDQGSQFTSLAFTGRLLAQGITISMDGRGRCFDNIWLERLWRSVKHEEVYLKNYGSVEEALVGLGHYFDKYNHHRPHQSLDYFNPAQVYFDNLKLEQAVILP